MNCGDDTATEVDREVMAILKESYEKALSMLRENRDILDRIAAYLIEKETITGKEFMQILHDIRDAHRKDKTTAEEETPAQEISKKLEDALNFEGSPQEQQIRSLMLGLGIDYDSLTKEEFVTLVGILSRADTWKIQQNLRGKTPLYQKHGKSKRHK